MGTYNHVHLLRYAWVYVLIDLWKQCVISQIDPHDFRDCAEHRGMVIRWRSDIDILLKKNTIMTSLKPTNYDTHVGPAWCLEVTCSLCMHAPTSLLHMIKGDFFPNQAITIGTHRCGWYTFQKYLYVSYLLREIQVQVTFGEVADTSILDSTLDIFNCTCLGTPATNIVEPTQLHT